MVIVFVFGVVFGGSSFDFFVCNRFGCNGGIFDFSIFVFFGGWVFFGFFDFFDD